MQARPKDPLDNLEDRLAATLKPVPPEQAFIKTVRQRISLAAPVVVMRPGPDLSQWLITVTEVASVFLVAALIARVVWYLVGRSK